MRMSSSSIVLKFISLLFITTEAQSVSDYIVVANELYIHQLSLDGSREQTLVSGLGFAVAIDYDFRLYKNTVTVFHAWMLSFNFECRRRYLYWTDRSRRTIMRSNLDGTNVGTILFQGLIQPGT